MYNISMGKEYENMINGKLYTCFEKDEKREDLFNKKNEFLNQFNSTSYEDYELREKLVRKYFGKVGKNIVINKPLYVDYGANVEIGDNFYANYDCIFLDVCKIKIGNNVMLGPRVCLYTPSHPIDKDIRNTQLEYGKPITIGNDCWICGNVIINPGVTIGNNVVIGSGSVVTKDIQDNVIAAGNPCKVIRKITNEDKEYWEHKKEEYFLNKEKKHEI